MEIGIDSFAAKFDDNSNDNDVEALEQLLDRIEHADKMGLHSFGIGEHHRREFLDSAPTMILAAAAARTKRIRLHSAVTVLSAGDPVRVFQNFATLDLLSKGRAEMVVGRGSFVEAYPLFGLSLQDYDALFAEKLGLLLKIRDNEFVTWSGKFRPAMNNQPVYPRPVQKPLPIWLGVGGTPESFVRAGMLGLPLMVAIIGGETHRFRPLVDLYRQAGLRAGYKPEQLIVGMHAFGYVAENSKQAADEMYEGYKIAMSGSIAKDRNFPPITRPRFDAQAGPLGAFLLGSPQDVAEKIKRHSDALGGLTRVSFQMDTANMKHDQLMNAIELIGTQVIPMVNDINDLGLPLK
ncbi:LLM class flavin-dependent oxidoreductase [Dyadobacter arcticus]|uniref:LLM family oxidoreductase n=1 Tax=Dyadobacter arcticus TaxID=1078754 RepID=A0ABX0UNY1_9BACT|nr:LLM class flavin-dependent oxidoreductase [Dyadobacter arcticus]NIJ54567.1 putative LLM family oxidoreductase [Dyadobacter arcticus]